MLLLAAAQTDPGYVRTKSQGSDLYLYWATRQIPMAVHVASDGRVTGQEGAGCLVDEAEPQVEQSFTSWATATRATESEPCTDIHFTFRTTTRIDTGFDSNSGSNINLVIWRNRLCSDQSVVPASDSCFNDNTCANKYGCWDHDNGLSSTIALTTTTYDESTGQILDADMELHGWSGNANDSGWYFTCQDSGDPCGSKGQSGCVSVDLMNTVTHEAGHVIGLDHEPNAAATMYASAPIGEISKRYLWTGDIEGVCLIYPVGGPTWTSVTTQGYPHKVSGCGTAGGVGGLAALLLAGLALLRRRRATRS